MSVFQFLYLVSLSFQQSQVRVTPGSVGGQMTDLVSGEVRWARDCPGLRDCPGARVANTHSPAPETVRTVRHPGPAGASEGQQLSSVERRGEESSTIWHWYWHDNQTATRGGGVGTCQSPVSAFLTVTAAQLILHPSLLPGLARASPAQPPGEMDNARLGKTTKDWLSILTIGDSSLENLKLKLVLTRCLLLTLLSPAERKSQMSGSGDISQDK